MKYYKLINESVFVGIVSSDDFRKFQLKHRLLLRSNEEHGSYVCYNNQYYRDRWMVPVNNNFIKYTEVDVIEIDEEEYTALASAIERNEEIEVEVQQEEEPIDEQPFEEIVDEPDVEEEVDPDIALEFVRTSKLKEMSYTCRKTITDGFDLTLSDNKAHHFSLTVQDQLNLLTISSEVLSGEAEVIYHADGEVCKYYSVEDATAIVNAATKHKTYHTTYYNSLKVYINSLDNITDISNIEYGVEIPEEYQSDILKSLIQKNINDENNTIEDEESNAEVDDIINNDSIVEDE